MSEQAAPLTRRAVFLDRDGVLLEERGYLTRSSQMVVIAGACEAVRVLRGMEFAVIVVTNQSAVARGLLAPDELDALHGELLGRFAAAGAPLDGIYVCPHHPEGTVAALRCACDCRKPAPGLVLRAAREHGIALLGSWLAGDQWSDLECARAAGLAAILVRTGKGAALVDRARRESPEVAVCDSIADIPALVARSERGRGGVGRERP